MSNTSSTTLSNKRVIITLCIYILVPIVAHLLNFLLQQYDISLMFSLNLATAILVMYNWNLFALHYNRAKQNLADALLYSILAFFLIGIWTYISNHFLKCIVIMPSKTVIIQYGYARIGMLIAYSFSEATLISIVEKVATDHINVKHHELQVIMLSGLAIGLLTTILFFPSKNILTVLITLLYNVILCTLLSYFYNQSHSFIPGIIGFAGSNLAFMILCLL